MKKILICALLLLAQACSPEESKVHELPAGFPASEVNWTLIGKTGSSRTWIMPLHHGWLVYHATGGGRAGMAFVPKP